MAPLGENTSQEGLEVSVGVKTQIHDQCTAVDSNRKQHTSHVEEMPFDRAEQHVEPKQCKGLCNDSYQHNEVVYPDKLTNSNVKGNDIKQNIYSDKANSVGNVSVKNGSDLNYDGKQKPLSIDAMFTVVGEYGLFQIIANIMMCIMVIPASFHLVIIYFVADIPSWKCALNSTNSTSCLSNKTFDSDDRSRCEMPRSEWHYTLPKDYSIITQFDISCHDEWLISLTTTLFFLGWLLGAVILGWCTDIYGRVRILFISMTMVLGVGLISAFMPSFYSFGICRFIVGFFSPGTFPQMFIVMSEMVGDKKRPFAGILIFLFFTVGTCLLCVKAYFVRHWKLLCIVCTAPYLFVLLFFKFIPESVRYLRVRGKIAEAMSIFERIASWNKKTIQPDVILSTPSSYVTAHKTNPIDLFRTFNLASKTLIQGYLWFACGVVYMGLYLAADDLDGGLYHGFFILTATEIPVIVVIIYLTKRFGRKYPTMISMLIGSVTCAAVGVIPKHGKIKVARIILGAIGKCFTTASFYALHTWSIELYPSNIRGEGMGFMQVSTRIGTACAPWVAKELKRIHPAAPFAVMGAIPFVAFCLMFLLPETKGVATTDSDDELEKKIGDKNGRIVTKISLSEVA